MIMTDENGHNTNKVRLTIDNWIAIVGLLLAVSGGLWGMISSRLTDIEKRLSDHEGRLIRREANAFTAQEANILGNSVSRLSVEMIQVEKTLEAQRTAWMAANEKLDKVDRSLRVQPAEVYAVANEIKKVADESKQMLTQVQEMLQKQRAENGND